MNFKQLVRPLVKAPTVTIIATLSLGLGIGATSAIFSVFHQLLLRTLPVEDPGRLVNLSAPGPKPGNTSCNNAGDCESVFSYPMFRDLEREQTVFTGIAAHVSFGANLAYRGQTLNGEGVLVSGGYFSVLGVRPALGRLIGPDDDRTVGQSPVAVLSHRFWQSRFNGNPAVLNDTLIVNGQPMVIVGVAPEGFDGTTVGSRPQVFVPITMRAVLQPAFGAFASNRRSYWAYLFARLKPKVSIEQARIAINGPYRNIINEVEAPLQTGMSEQTMARFRNKEVLVEPGARGQSDLHTEARPPLILLMCVAAFVLLIACANVANLLLARGAARSGEIALRLSIGASRYQLVRQLLSEALLIAALGGLLGLLTARWTLDLIVSLLPSGAPQQFDFVIDVPVILFAAVVTIATGLLFGMFPALHSTRADLLSALKGQTGQPSGARAAARFRTTLATAQVALSMMLLIAAGLFMSLFNIARVDLGLSPERIVTFSVSPEANGYKPEQSRTFFERLEDDLAAAPGAASAAASLVQILSGSNWGRNVSVQGFEAGPDTDTNASYNAIGPGYFRTLGIPLIAGREFTRADAAGAPKVAIVNERFAEKFRLGREAVGKRMRIGARGELDIEIVGLVRNAKYSQVKDAPPPQFFVPYRQQDRGPGFLSFYARTSGEPEAFLGTIPRLVARIDPNLPVENLMTLPQQIRENIVEDRVVGILSGAFALAATILAAIGLYGVLAYTVAQRTREFGVRMVLGADPSSVRRMVLGRVGLMTLVGGTVGLTGAIGLGRLAQSMLFQVQSHDPVVAVSASIFLGLVALAAGFAPARRASGIDPMQALRYE